MTQTSSLGFRVRRDVSANYNSVFIDGSTIRTALDPSKPITELPFPEFYDLSFGNRCSGGCEYCYAGATRTGVHYTNLVDKIDRFFGTMTMNQRPHQCAIGGEQEPLENPEAWAAMARLRELDIIPNYTTNGMFVTEKTVEPTKRICGGAAVTLHPHLEKHWRRAIKILSDGGVKLNVHVIISDEASVDYTERLYNEFVETGMVDYFVLLPYMNTGHAALHPKKIAYDRLETWLDRIYEQSRVAFGANFYRFIERNAVKYKVSLYPPEIFSKYLIMDDGMRVSNNSFEKRPVMFSHESGCELGHARTEFPAN